MRNKLPEHCYRTRVQKAVLRTPLTTPRDQVRFNLVELGGTMVSELAERSPLLLGTGLFQPIRTGSDESFPQNAF
jgi:hypothetical protein